MGQISKSVCIALLVILFTRFAEAMDQRKIFNVKEFGAISDGKTDGSKALTDAWKEACQWDGNARILIPEGTFLIGPVILQGPCKGPIVLQVKGLVKAPTLDKFDSESWFDFRYLSNLTLTGGGHFDAQGALDWPQNQCTKTFKCKPLPTSLRFSFVNDTTIRRVTSIDSKFFHIFLFASYNVKLQRIKISAPKDSPNTDGIHVALSSEIKISRSIIGTGDDCISIGPGNSNITISGVRCGPGHGISVGSLGKNPDEGDVVGLHVRNCTLIGTDNGVRIKTWPSSPTASSVSDFTFDDIVMDHVNNPIVIDQQYCPWSYCDLKSPSLVKISNVRFNNIRGVSASKVAVKLLCSSGVPCQDVKLSDIDLEYSGPEEGTSTATCVNAKGVSSGHQIPPSCL